MQAKVPDFGLLVCLVEKTPRKHCAMPLVAPVGWGGGTAPLYSGVDFIVMTTTYREAAALLWGEAGAYMHDAYARFRPYFSGIPESLPMVIGLTAYGKCIGLTRASSDLLKSPRISIASNLFGQGRRAVDDVVLHEMMHVSLNLAGKASAHNSAAWYSEVRRLAPDVLGHDVDIKRGADRRSVRVPNPDYQPDSDLPKTVVRKEPVPVKYEHKMVARFPQAFRPDGYDLGEPIEVYSY